MSLGKLPSAGDLEGVATFSKDGSGHRTDAGSTKGKEEGTTAEQGTCTLMSLFASQSALASAAQAKKVWLGNGLGSVTAKVHERMWKWEFVDMEEFRPRSTQEKITPGNDTEKLVVFSGTLEVSQPRKRPITDIITWVQCYARYTAGMAEKYPEAVPGFMSHLIVVLKAYSEVEGLWWRDYDVAFRDKMAAQGVKKWTGMDVSLYQDLVGSKPRRSATPATVSQSAGEQRRKGSLKRHTADGHEKVCWLYNDSICSYNPCKFPHLCETCLGPHPKRACTRNVAKRPVGPSSVGAQGRY